MEHAWTQVRVFEITDSFMLAVPDGFLASWGELLPGSVKGPSFKIWFTWSLSGIACSLAPVSYPDVLNIWALSAGVLHYPF